MNMTNHLMNVTFALPPLRLSPPTHWLVVPALVSLLPSQCTTCHLGTLKPKRMMQSLIRKGLQCLCMSNCANASRIERSVNTFAP
jgi:hypothetical protein